MFRFEIELGNIRTRNNGSSSEENQRIHDDVDGSGQGRSIQSRRNGHSREEEQRIHDYFDGGRKVEERSSRAVFGNSSNSMRLRLFKAKGYDGRKIQLLCDKSSEVDLWECTVTAKALFNSNSKPVSFNLNLNLAKLKVLVCTWRENGSQIWLMQSLASQSSFFDNLFFGNFKEKNMTEITIEDVDYEIIYRLDGIDLTDDNVCKVLQQIVEGACTYYLLSTSSDLSIREKLQISEENNLPLLKEEIIGRYNESHLRDLAHSPVWEVLSKETTKALMERSCAIISSICSGYSDSYQSVFHLTTRPETIYADVALAIHPSHPRVNELRGRRARNPLDGRELPIVVDEAVLADKGTDEWIIY
uniref:BTB domain-containing protein n=1 Tax=Pristionchus pacificus TaxID=54126 RepID=A0A2A6BWK3_PRIPA|eukprot:PDM70258.1 BTB domain-containing protein [Pristionchus pacificus]